MMRLKKELGCKKGQTLVETALVLPIILILIMGIIEFGRIFNAYMIVSSASREGARHAALGHTNTEIIDRVNDITSSTLGTVTINITPSLKDDRIRGVNTEVTVTHTLTLITPVIGPIISPSNSFDIEASTEMRVE